MQTCVVYSYPLYIHSSPLVASAISPPSTISWCSLQLLKITLQSHFSTELLLESPFLPDLLAPLCLTHCCMTLRSMPTNLRAAEGKFFSPPQDSQHFRHPEIVFHPQISAKPTSQLTPFLHFVPTSWSN